jgi:hypothetical protein
VAEHSEHRDASRAGDFGEWSAREATPFPREVAILQRLDVNEMHSPVDSPIGIQIIKRTPNRERQNYAMAAIRLRFDPEQPPSAASSKVAVGNRARALIHDLSKAPERFSQMQEELCCTNTLSWSAGRRPPALEEALNQLRVGQISEYAIEADLSFFIAKRVSLENKAEAEKSPK